MMMNTVLPIQIQSLCKVFKDKRRREIQALKGLSLEVCPGEIMGFLGPNGAGKSTTIKTLVGLLKPTSGSVRIYDRPSSDRASRKKIGYLPESPAFYDFLTGREYLKLVGEVFGMASKEIATEGDRILEILDLTHAASRPIRGYSKGMVQRLGLAQALLHNPDLYILDEPMSGLDPLGRALVKDILCDLKEQGKTVFFSTHVTADVEAVCDQVAVLVDGELQSVASVHDLLDQGVEGYKVQFSGCSVTEGDGFAFTLRPGQMVEVSVAVDQLDRCLSLVAQRGGKIQRLEPVRRNLERFFLDIVQQKKRTP